MNQSIYLICGVSGSGKSWICRQLRDKFTYVEHDKFYAPPSKMHVTMCNRLYQTALKDAAKGDKPVITECPFAERTLREDLEKAGFKVIPYFVIEPTSVVQHRYRTREGKEVSAAVITRSVTIRKRADEWDAPSGTSNEILAMLKRL